MNTSKRTLYVYLQRPDNGEWVTVGAYFLNLERKEGRFRYAPSYIDAGLTWSIDPVNLPFIPGSDFIAPRYNRLHDVLRDASPDAWGRMIMQREHGIGQNALDVDYLAQASNQDRWGALAVGSTRRPSIGHLASPRLDKLDALVAELQALSERRPAVNAAIRRRLVGTTSMGGARAKATVVDSEGNSWLAKPYLASDVVDIPRLEHFCQSWGAAAGLNFAHTELHPITPGQSVVRVLRYDRRGDRRIMAISGATLLETECPPTAAAPAAWSYPRLADQLRRIGAPQEDRIELFGRMIFNAVCGNDDDHPRNHAAVYEHEQRCWRLSPAFDVVANPEITPQRLSLRMGRFDPAISQEAALSDALRFGFATLDDARTYLDRLLERIEEAYHSVEPILTPDLQVFMRPRMEKMVSLLKGSK